MLAWTLVLVWDITLNDGETSKSVLSCLDNTLPQASLLQVYSYFEENDVQYYTIFTVDEAISKPVYSVGERVYNSFFIISDRSGTVAVVVFYDPNNP